MWRFVLRPGVLTEMAVAGVLMPSVDAVNRHFPLTIAAVAAANMGAFTLAAEADRWFVAAERLALSCLAPEATISSIERGLERLGPVPMADQHSPNSGPTGSLGCWQLAADLPDNLRSVCPHILDTMARLRTARSACGGRPGRTRSSRRCCSKQSSSGSLAKNLSNWLSAGYRFDSPLEQEIAAVVASVADVGVFGGLLRLHDDEAA